MQTVPLTYQKHTANPAHITKENFHLISLICLLHQDDLVFT